MACCPVCDEATTEYRKANEKLRDIINLIQQRETNQTMMTDHDRQIRDLETMLRHRETVTKQVQSSQRLNTLIKKRIELNTARMVLDEEALKYHGNLETIREQARNDSNAKYAHMAVVHNQCYRFKKELEIWPDYQKYIQEHKLDVPADDQQEAIAIANRHHHDCLLRSDIWVPMVELTSGNHAHYRHHCQGWNASNVSCNCGRYGFKWDIIDFDEYDVTKFSIHSKRPCAMIVQTFGRV